MKMILFVLALVLFVIGGLGTAGWLFTIPTVWPFLFFGLAAWVATALVP